MKNSYFTHEKRLDKVPPYLREDLIFDLINAFGLVKNSFEAAQLLQDLLTKKELDNLSKRLRIAKKMLSGSKQEEIVDELHCGFGTIARVQTWLHQGGAGLRNIIVKLPIRKTPPRKKLHALPPSYRMPQIAFEAIQHLRAHNESSKIKKFIEKVEEKAIGDKSLREANDEYYRNKAGSKRKI